MCPHSIQHYRRGPPWLIPGILIIQVALNRGGGGIQIGLDLIYYVCQVRACLHMNVLTCGYVETGVYPAMPLSALFS